MPSLNRKSGPFCPGQGRNASPLYFKNQHVNNSVPLAHMLLSPNPQNMETNTNPAMDEWEERVSSVAREIEQYLAAHPQALDSLEGIATWWVLRQRIRTEVGLVRAALGQLMAAGVVSAEQIGNTHDPVYRLKKNGSSVSASKHPERTTPGLSNLLI
jgi:hypothetical protein